MQGRQGVPKSLEDGRVADVVVREVHRDAAQRLLLRIFVTVFIDICSERCIAVVISCRGMLNRRLLGRLAERQNAGAQLRDGRAGVPFDYPHLVCSGAIT